ncbi:hypothetical protein DESPIGER_0422 [Desulfovibrio piger]|uniref:Uncharacterized protein n=1 Tax=Desulfovibrio piger TaxID=901 RepID=A0A1K1LC84_9BACT|nr:hypothetical protein DESPIGER_0422 [Desulfovibrio piger]
MTGKGSVCSCGRGGMEVSFPVKRFLGRAGLQRVCRCPEKKVRSIW